jgi:hypothetical protein
MGSLGIKKKSHFAEFLKIYQHYMLKIPKINFLSNKN